jgi:hypothetical protein
LDGRVLEGGSSIDLEALNRLVGDPLALDGHKGDILALVGHENLVAHRDVLAVSVKD